MPTPVAASKKGDRLETIRAANVVTAKAIPMGIYVRVNPPRPNTNASASTSAPPASIHADQCRTVLASCGRALASSNAVSCTARPAPRINIEMLHNAVVSLGWTRGQAADLSLM